MDICIITHEFPPVRAGGIAPWAYGLAKSFMKNENANITVFVRKRGGCDDFDFHNGSGINVVPMIVRNWHDLHFFYSWWYLRKYLRTHIKPIVLTATWEPAKAAAVLKDKYPHFLMVGAHGIEVSRLKFKPESDRKKFRKTIAKSNLVLPVSNYTKNSILDFAKVPEEKILVTKSTVDLDQFSILDKSSKITARKKFGIDDNAKVLISLCRIIPRKGHDIVIQALPEVVKIFPNFVYVIAGTGGDSWKDYLMNIARNNKVENHIKFLGYIGDNEKNDIYNMADCYIMVSKNPEKDGDSEGFGLTYLEANAAGLPVIGSRTGGIPDAIEENKSGILVEPENVKQTADAIIDLLSNQDKSHSMGLYGRERALQNFTWDIIASNIIEKYRQLSV